MATAQLTDEELFSELKSFGFTPGPVSENTRPVYLKKLKKLREEQQQQKGTRAGKTRNSGGSINNSSGGGNSSYTAAGARPASNDVTHLSTSSRSPGGRPVLNEKRTGGAGKFVLGFSSDESDVEDPKKKRGANHSGRRDRGSAYHQQQQQQIRPTTGAATATRKSLGVAVSTSRNNSSPAGLLEGRRSGPGSLGWVDRGKSSLEDSRPAEVKGYDEEPEEEGDFQGETERDSRSLNGNRASYSLNTSSKLVGDYSDSEEEEEEEEEGGITYGQDRQRDRHLQQHYSRRSHSSKPSPHRSARGSESGQETTTGMAIRLNDTPGASRSRLDMMGGRGEEEDDEEGKKRVPGESSLSGSLLRRHYPRGTMYVSAVTGGSDRGSPGESSGNNSPTSAYNKNHTDSGDGATSSSSSSRFSIGLRPRFSNYNTLSATYRPNHSNHSGPNHAYSQSSLKQKHTVPEDELLQQFKREEVGSSTGGWGFSAHYLSMFLLMAACLFFLLLGLMYLRMRGSGASEVDVVSKYPA